jgi:hypothetical protein
VVNLERRKELGDYLDSQATHHTLKEYQQILKQVTGTAIFLEHDGKRYLITNRHVLYDQDMVLQKRKYHIADPVAANTLLLGGRFSTLASSTDTTYQEYPVSIEGLVDVEVRPQVPGTITVIAIQKYLP